jgi:hypothetical protein
MSSSGLDLFEAYGKWITTGDKRSHLQFFGDNRRGDVARSSSTKSSLAVPGPAVVQDSEHPSQQAAGVYT